jgi:hypothetical protein
MPDVLVAAAEAAAARRTTAELDASEVPVEDQLDAYLYGRALREWASDEYLDELGIDRTMCDAYAEALSFEERIVAIRHLSFVARKGEFASA